MVVFSFDCFDWFLVLSFRFRFFFKLEFQIAEISKQFGAEIPFIRNKELSDDFAIIHDVISDAIFNLEDNNFKFDYACCIYATAPFLNENDLKMGFEIVHQNKNKIAFAASKYSYPVQRSFFINDPFTLSGLLLLIEV